MGDLRGAPDFVTSVTVVNLKLYQSRYFLITSFPPTYLMQSHHSRTPGDGATADGAEEVDEHRMASRSVCWFRSKSTFGAGAVGRMSK